MSRALFGRCWSLTIIPRAGARAIQYSSAPNQGRPLRFEFDVKRTLHSASNKGNIRLTNLSAESAAVIDIGARVELRCGYGSFSDSYASLIFVGNVLNKTSDLQGSDYITQLECGDGEILLQNAYVQASFSQPTTLDVILRKIVEQLRVEISGQSFSPDQTVTQNLPRDEIKRFVCSGPAKTVLDALLNKRGIAWSIQNGTLLLQANQGIVNLNAVYLSPATGLLEKPKASKKGTEFKALIQAAIQPGGAVTIASSATEASGNFRVVEVTYKGDTHGADWSCEVLAEQLTLPLASYIPQTTQTPGTSGATDDLSGETSEDGEPVE